MGRCRDLHVVQSKAAAVLPTCACACLRPLSRRLAWCAASSTFPCLVRSGEIAMHMQPTFSVSITIHWRPSLPPPSQCKLSSLRARVRVVQGLVPDEASWRLGSLLTGGKSRTSQSAGSLPVNTLPVLLALSTRCYHVYNTMAPGTAPEQPGHSISRLIPCPPRLDGIMHAAYCALPPTQGQ